MQRIPCVLMRGGTSRGPFFLRADLPSDDGAVDDLLIRAMGTPSTLQVDGVGGGHPLTSKVAIVERSTSPDADIDYAFVQVDPHEARVDRRPNCGNMLSAVGPFAIDSGLVNAADRETHVRIRNTNTNALIEAVVQTPNGRVEYEGSFALDGVAGTAAPIRLMFQENKRARGNDLLPTAHVVDTIDGVPVTLINGEVPLLIVQAEALNLRGDETPHDLDRMPGLRERIGMLRLQAGYMMGLGDVAGSVVPKVAIISPPRFGGTLTVRYLTPVIAHTALAVTGGVTLVRALLSRDSLIGGSVQALPEIVLEHPAGKMSLGVEHDGPGEPDPSTARISLIRTARRIFEGHICIPNAS